MKRLSLALCLCLLASACAPKSRSSEKKDTPAPKTIAPADDPAKNNSAAGKTSTPSGGTATGSPQTGSGEIPTQRHLQLSEGTLAVTLPLQEWKSNEVKASNLKPGQNVGRSFKYVADADVTLKLNETSLYEIHSGCSSGETRIYMNTVTASGVKNALKGEAADLFLKRGQDAFVLVVIDNKGNCTDVNYAFAVLAIPAASASVSPTDAPGSGPVEKLVVKTGEFRVLESTRCGDFACLARGLDRSGGKKLYDPQNSLAEIVQSSYDFGGQSLELRCLQKTQVKFVGYPAVIKASCEMTFVPSQSSEKIQIVRGQKTVQKVVRGTITDNEVLARLASALPLGYLNSDEKVEVQSLNGDKTEAFRLSLQCDIKGGIFPTEFEKCEITGIVE